jgi:hypothetical protein
LLQQGDGGESFCSATSVSVAIVPGEARKEPTAFGVGAASVSREAVYVMNANKKTIGVYDLDTSYPPNTARDGRPDGCRLPGRAR